jgi:hypothetical protein
MLRLKRLLLLVLPLALAGCYKPPSDPDPVPPKYCDGEGCVEFTVAKAPQCITAEDPTALGVFVETLTPKTDDGKITMIYKIEVRSVANEVLRQTANTTLPLPTNAKQFLTCNTGRDTVNGVRQKVFNYIAPGCATSRAFPPASTCALRPPTEQFPPSYRFPRAPSFFESREPSYRPDCKSFCSIKDHPLCKHFALPNTFSKTAQSKWSAALQTFHREIIDDARFPITPDRMKEIFDEDPRDHGRPGSIYLTEGQMGQAGDATSLQFITTIDNAVVRADIVVPSLIAGTRSLVDEDIVQWIPLTSDDTPTLKFPNNADYDSVFGGEISQIFMSPKSFVVGTTLRCAALDYN